jgi:hypothetical protein
MMLSTGFAIERQADPTTTFDEWSKRVTKDGSQSCRFSSYAPDTCRAWNEQGACWTARDGPSDLIPVVNLNTVTSSSVPGSKFNRVRDIPQLSRLAQ